MPSIQRNTAQETALQEINEALQSIKTLNPILDEHWDGTALVTFVIGKGRNGSIKLPFTSEDKEMLRLVSIASSYKSKLVKEITAKATKFSIKLEAGDEAIMRGGMDTTEEVPTPKSPTPPMTRPATAPFAPPAAQTDNADVDDINLDAELQKMMGDD